MAMASPVEPKLPPLPDLEDAEGLRVTHSFSSSANWLVPGHVLLGAYPGNDTPPDQLETDELALMRSLRLDGGVGTFVCLQEEIPRGFFAPGAEGGAEGGAAEGAAGGAEGGAEGGAAGVSTRAGLSSSLSSTSDFRPYAADAHRVGSSAPLFVHFPMADHSVASSLEALDALVLDLVDRVRHGEVLYIHCMAGLGRTGLVAACLLGRLYPTIDPEDALRRVQRYFDLRGDQRDSPENFRQRQQVRRYFGFVADGRAGGGTSARGTSARGNSCIEERRQLRDSAERFHERLPARDHPSAFAPKDSFSSSFSSETSWHVEWQRRVACWWLALPAPTQTQISSCLSALSLHLGSRLDSALRGVGGEFGTARAGRQASRLRACAHARHKFCILREFLERITR